MSKKTLISIGVIAGLIVLILAVKNFHCSNLPSVKTWEGSADEMVIKKKTDAEIVIKRKDGVWLVGVEGYPGDASQIESLEKKMNEIALSELITDKFPERFDLTDTTAIRVTVKKDGKVLRDVMIGKRSSAGEQAYIMFAGKKEVYLVGGNLASEFDKTVDALRNKTLLQYTNDTIESVTVKAKGRTFTLERQTPQVNTPAAKDAKTPSAAPPQPVWTLKADSAALDQNKVTEFINEFGNVSASSFPVESDAKKVSQSTQSEIMLKVKGKEITFTVYGKDPADKSGNFICRSSDIPYYASVGAWKAEKFIKTADDLKIKK